MHVPNNDAAAHGLPASPRQKIRMESHRLLDDGVEMWQRRQGLEVGDGHARQLLADLANVLGVRRELVEDCCEDLARGLAITNNNLVSRTG